MPNNTVLIELHYLPSIAYMALLSQMDIVDLDVKAHYEKQSFRNRTRLLGANGVETLIVPVLGGNKKQAFDQIKIDHQQKWKQVHLRSIQSAYGKAPFFEFYFPYFSAIYEKDYVYLAEFNLDLLTICLKLLKLPVKLRLKESFEKTVGSDVLDSRNLIHPKKNHESLDFFEAPTYHQLFGKSFEPNLSIIDLLFCEGPRSEDYLRLATKIESNK